MVLGFVDSLKDVVRKAGCQALDASESFGNSLVAAWQDWTGLTGVNPPNFASIAKGLLCGTPAPVLPPGTTTPQGGQCDCVIYRVTGYLTRKNQVNLHFSNTRVYGPITGFVAVPGGFNPPFVTTYNITCKGAPPAACGSSTAVSIGAGASDGNITGYVISSIRREDGLPDDCGDTPEPVIDQPPDPIDESPDIEFEFSPDLSVEGKISATANVTFLQAQVNFNGQLVVPFNLNTNIDLGGVNFNLTGNLNINTGDINFNFGGGDTVKAPGFDSPCEEPVKPVRPVPPPPSDSPPKPEDPDVETEDVIIGVLVAVNNTSLQRKATIISQSANPSIYAPALGFVNFFCPYDGSGGGAWTPDLPVKNTYTLIACPWPEGASGVAGTPNPGVTWTLTPIKRKRPKTIRS